MRTLCLPVLLAIASCVVHSRVGSEEGGSGQAPDGSVVGDAGYVRMDAGWTVVPSGTTADLRSVWGSDDEAWAVGKQGTVLHWLGVNGTWQPEDSGVRYDLYGVWGSAPTDVWAVGWGVILHWNGEAWSVPFPGLQHIFSSISGTSATDVWAVGTDCCTLLPTPVALHWDGGSWSSTDTSGLDGGLPLGVNAWSPGYAAAASDEEVAEWNAWNWYLEFPGIGGGHQRLTGGVFWQGVTWVTAADGGLYNRYIPTHGDWNPTATGVTSDLHAVLGFPTGTFWMVGNEGSISTIGSGPNPVTFSGVTPHNLYGLTSTPSRTLWAVGDRGTILHYASDGECPVTWSDARALCTAQPNVCYPLGVQCSYPGAGDCGDAGCATAVLVCRSTDSGVGRWACAQ